MVVWREEGKGGSSQSEGGKDNIRMTTSRKYH